MATGQGLIEDSLLELGVGSPGDELDESILNHALRVLNKMWSSWSAEIAPVYTRTLTTHTWAGSTASQTISLSGSDITLAQPVQITGFQMRVSSVDYTLNEVSFEQYQTTAIKTITSAMPTVFSYVRGASEGTIYIYPLLSASSTARIQTIQPLTDFTLAGTVALPAGYEEAVQTNLAIRLAPTHGKSARPELVDRAQKSKLALENLNEENNEMWPDPMMPGLFVGDDIDLFTTS